MDEFKSRSKVISDQEKNDWLIDKLVKLSKLLESKDWQKIWAILVYVLETSDAEISKFFNQLDEERKIDFRSLAIRVDIALIKAINDHEVEADLISDLNDSLIKIKRVLSLYKR